MKFNKKAAMELGISTVVMLVIAIVIIGGGIAFIQSFFSGGKGDLEDIMGSVRFSEEPTRDRPILLSSGSNLNVKAGDKETIGVAIYNSEGFSVNVEPNITCSDDEAIEGIETISVDIEPGEFKEIPVFLTMAAGSGDYICTLKAEYEEGNDKFKVSTSIVIKAR